MSRLDAIRAHGWTAHQLMLRAKETGDVLLAAEADRQAVVERLRKGPHQLLPVEREVVDVWTRSLEPDRRVS